MRWVNIHKHTGDSVARAGVLTADDRIFLHPSGLDLHELIRAGDLESAGQECLNNPAPLRLSDVVLAAPIQVPGAVRDFMAFEEHLVNATGKPAPDRWHELPVFYFSNPAAIRAHSENVPLAPGSARMDYELEMAAVIGKEVENCSLENAWDAIAGFVLLCDWSARDVQFDEMTVGLGPAKGKDTAISLGPWMLSKAALEPYREGRGFNISCSVSVNGTIYTKSDFNSMGWSFEQMIVYASRGTKLRPGDVIGSGTVGKGCILELRMLGPEQDFPWLTPGDRVRLEADLLGHVESVMKPSVTVHEIVEG